MYAWIDRGGLMRDMEWLVPSGFVSDLIDQ